MLHDRLPPATSAARHATDVLVLAVGALAVLLLCGWPVGAAEILVASLEHGSSAASVGSKGDKLVATSSGLVGVGVILLLIGLGAGYVLGALAGCGRTSRSE